MRRKIHKVLILLATLNYFSLLEIQSKTPSTDISATVESSLIFLLILVAILAVDILFNITAYIRGTVKGVVKDKAKKGIFSFIADIFNT